MCRDREETVILTWARRAATVARELGVKDLYYMLIDPIYETNPKLLLPFIYETARLAVAAGRPELANYIVYGTTEPEKTQ